MSYLLYLLLTLSFIPLIWLPYIEVKYDLEERFIIVLFWPITLLIVFVNGLIKLKRRFFS